MTGMGYFEFFAYNFIRLHRTLRVSRAMAAGVTDRLWDVNDLVALGVIWIAEGGKSGSMSRFPEWLALPWVVVFIGMMIWTPKTRKGWYLAASILVCQTAVVLYLQFSSSH